MSSPSKADLFRQIPSVDELCRTPEMARLAAREGSIAVTDAVRVVLTRLRGEISAGRLSLSELDLALSRCAEAVEQQLEACLSSLRCVINATGVILHTNLGRAPLSAAALDHIRETAAGYSNLEFDIEQGQRGKRDANVARLFQKLFGDSLDSSTIVVNNNAAAVLLALNTLAEHGEVIVSRGELVEIGGSFRIPDVMAKSNAILREVGSTNRTRIADYESAINDQTRLLLRVHRSNFAITGFTEQPSMQELVALARKYKLPLMEDLGSGAFFDLRAIGVEGELTVFDTLRSGVDVVSYSGDKLLGGPQAGILTGQRELISRMRSNSLFRALRVDKLTYAALEATLLAYRRRDFDAIPSLRMMRLSQEEIGERAEAVAAQARTPRLMVEVIEGESVIGGGAAPSAVLLTKLLAITCEDLSANDIANQLRSNTPPIIVRIELDRVLLDLRTVFPAQDAAIIQALKLI